MQHRAQAERTPDQILRSVIAYCTWRAGECWRNLSISKFRYDQERWDYLEAARIVHSVRYASPTAVSILSASLEAGGAATLRGKVQPTLQHNEAGPGPGVMANLGPALRLPTNEALSPELRQYMTWPRAQLAAELVRIDPRYTDRKLLQGLSIQKLARMLADAMAAQRRFA